MKNILYLITVFFIVAACNCPDKKQKDAVVKDSLNTQNIEKRIMKFKKVNGKDTLQLELSFDNQRSVLNMVLNGETCELKQDTMASGIQYSNEHYKFNEHQGLMTLEHDGKIIFEEKLD